MKKITDDACDIWEKFYDGRDRLTKAERNNSSATLQNRYTYTYDDADIVAPYAILTIDIVLAPYIEAMNEDLESRPGYFKQRRTLRYSKGDSWKITDDIRASVREAQSKSY